MEPTEDEMICGTMGLDLATLRRWANDIAGQWNGKTEKGEDKAHCALDIAKKAEELQELLKEIETY